jgi:hypothetical protein
MPEVDKLATVSVRAADLADRCEAAGALVVAAQLREIAQEVEEAILETVPPELPGWMAGGGPEPAAPVLLSGNPILTARRPRAPAASTRSG